MIVLMVQIRTLSNPLQYLTSPKKSRREGGFLDSTTYASNGLENWLSLICTNIKLPCKDHKIRINNAFILLNVRYYSIVCHFCSWQPVYKREINPKQGITSCFKWLSDIISRFTECSRSPNSLCGSSMKNHCYKNVEMHEYKLKIKKEPHVLVAYSA